MKSKLLLLLSTALFFCHAQAIDKPEWPPEALERYDLGSLTIVKVQLTGKCAPYAVIQDPDGYVHRLFLGNHIGKNFGLVKEIKKDSIKIEEVVQNDKDEWEARAVWLKK